MVTPVFSPYFSFMAFNFPNFSGFFTLRNNVHIPNNNANNPIAKNDSETDYANPKKIST